MKKALWWIAVILFLLGLASFVPDNDMPKGLGVFFLICAVGIGAGLIYHDNKTQKEESNANKQLWDSGFPIIYDLNPGHYTGAYEYEQWHAGYPDSAGGWDVQGCIKSISPYSINYVYLYVYPVDRIGNRVAQTECWKYTGPFNQGQLSIITAKHMWYDLSVAKVEVEKIVVDYNFMGTQVTASSASFTALQGRQAGTANWASRQSNPDGTWDVKSVIKYQAAKPSNRVVLYVIPLSANGTELAPAAELSSRQEWHKGKTMTVWWSGIWKNLPVTRVKIQKYTIEFTDGTSQVVEF